jgi:hypothetical protein
MKLDRHYINGTWYAPLHFLRNVCEEVLHAELWNTGSSAGDWDGWFVTQAEEGVYDIYLFFQENAWPHDIGFYLTTAPNPIATVTGEFEQLNFAEIFQQITEEQLV